MKIVIDIPEETYEALVINQYWGSKGDLENIIVNGTPLPKGRGRLIDISKYEDSFANVMLSYDDGKQIYTRYTNMIPTVIEADKE